MGCIMRMTNISKTVSYDISNFPFGIEYELFINFQGQNQNYEKGGSDWFVF